MLNFMMSWFKHSVKKKCSFFIVYIINFSFYVFTIENIFGSLKWFFIRKTLRWFLFFNRDLNRGCLVYMFTLRFSGSKFLINLQQQFRARKIFSCTWNFSYPSFCGIWSPFILCLKLLFWKCVTYVLGCSFI